MWNTFSLGSLASKPGKRQEPGVVERCGGAECLVSEPMTVRLLRLPQSPLPFHLFISGYTLSLFPFANESCVSRFITSRIRNAEFLIRDIWKELQVNTLQGAWAKTSTNNISQLRRLREGCLYKVIPLSYRT